MPTPLVPRTAVLAALGAAAALTVACDRLPFVGPRGPTTDLEVAVVAPLGDTLTQLGIDVRAALSGIAQIHTLMSERVHPWAYDGWYGVDSVLTAAFVPGPGRHTFTVVTADSGVHRRSVQFTRTFVITDVPYAVTALPDVGVASGARGMNEHGDVAGWVTTAEGRRRPAVWRRGQLTVVPAGTVDAGGRRAALLLTPSP